MSVLSSLVSGTPATVELRSDRGTMRGREGGEVSDASESRPVSQDTEGVCIALYDCLPVTRGYATHLEAEHSVLAGVRPDPGHHG